MFSDLSESLASYEGLIADLKAHRAELQRAERRIVLLGALLAVEGASVELPTVLQPEMAERLMARIEVIRNACIKRI